jgi:Na+/H+-dicarboxylate symporter
LERPGEVIPRNRIVIGSSSKMIEVVSTIKSLTSVLFSTLLGGTLLFQLGLKPQAVFFSLIFGAILGGLGHIFLDIAKRGTGNLNRKFVEVMGLIMIVAGSGLFVVQFIVYYFGLAKLVENKEIDESFIYYGVIFFGMTVVAGGRAGLDYTLGLLQIVAEKFVKGKTDEDKDKDK